MLLTPHLLSVQADVPPPPSAGQSPELGSVIAHRPKSLGLKRNFGWALGGNFIYQTSQWLNLMILAKLLTVNEVGQFALALAVCTPITAFSTLNLRVVQVTDTRDRHRFGHFLAVQLFMSALAIVMICCIAAFTTSEPQTAWVIVVVGLGQAVVSVRDIFLSYNQKMERMDAVAVSKTIIGVTSLTALGLGVWTTGSLLVGVIGLQASKLLIFLLWDLRVASRLVRMSTSEQNPSAFLRPRWDGRIMIRLAWLALPLGISAILLSLNNNIPRYYIAAYLDQVQLGYFAALVALALAGTLVMQAAGMSALPRLSHYYLENRRAYVKLLGKLISLGLVIGLASLALISVVGQQLLATIFTRDYAAYQDLFLWSMIFAAIAYVVTFLGYGMTAMRRFKVQPLANLSALIVIAITGWLLIPRYGLNAGVWSLIAGKIVQGFVTLLVILYGLRAGPPQQDARAEENRIEIH